MNSGGVIVLALYAQYFSEATEACASENWGWPLGGLPLSINRRNIFNQLVRDTNHELKYAVYDGREKDGFTNAQVVFADWDDWAWRMGGLMCEDGQDPDPTLTDKLMFFKLNTSPANLGDVPVGTIKIRGNISDFDEPLETEAIDAELEDAWAAARTVALPTDDHLNISYPLAAHIDKRGITSPSCPSGVLKNVVSYLLPDNIGKIFHPNIKGHEAIASFALDAVRIVRANQLNISPPGCVSNTLSCFADHDTGEYASDYAMYSATADFCNSVESGQPSGVANWQYAKTYYQGTLDEAEFRLELSGGASSFDKDQCNKAVNGILDGCDKYTTNPMNWKQGGTYTFGSYKYTVQPKKQNRPWPYPTEPKRELFPIRLRCISPELLMKKQLYRILRVLVQGRPRFLRYLRRGLGWVGLGPAKLAA